LLSSYGINFSIIATKCANNIKLEEPDKNSTANIMDFFDQAKVYSKYLLDSNIETVLKRFNPVEQQKINSSTKRFSRKRMGIASMETI
jgi:hypothetical protein